MWGLFVTLDGMHSYQIWDLALKFIASIVAFVSAWVAYSKFKDEQNRKNYEKRLNILYAPLYGQIVRQETYRSLYFPHIARQAAPIIYGTITKTKQTITCDQTGISTSDSTEESIDPLFDRYYFIRILNDENRGLARPKLLKLIHQYEVLLQQVDVSIPQHSDTARKAIVNVEFELVNEIIQGYKELIDKLGLDSKDVLKEIEVFSISEHNKCTKN